MSGISTGVGAFSGINSAQLIEQLISIESRPKTLIQRRVVQIQSQQSVYLDLINRLGSLKSTVTAFKDNNSFTRLTTNSSDSTVLTASADSTAAPGSYQFIVDRLVSSQQMLSRGFAGRDTGAVGLTSVTFESSRGRLDRDVSLSDLNGGDGVRRGKIVITDSANRAATIDLSKAATVNDVLQAINGNGTAAVTASVRDGKFVITDNASGTVRVENGTNSTTATSLGIAGTASGSLVGSSVYSLSNATALSALNDGNGVDTKTASGTNAWNFAININRGSGNTEVRVNLSDIYSDSTTISEGAVTTLGGALTRINAKLSEAGFADVRAEVTSDGQRIQIIDTGSGAGTSTISVAENGTGTTARDLGLSGSVTNGTLSGRKILAGMNSTLLSSLNGGAGIAGDGVLNFTSRDGNAFSVTIDKNASLDEITRQIETASGTGSNGRARLSVSLNSKGTGLLITDNTGATTSNLIITGTNGSDTAASLGISTGTTGVASATINGTNLQKQYISRSTLLSEINNGKGVGTGTFRITDGTGASATVTVGDSIRNLGDLIDLINSRGIAVTAKLNANGDGIQIIERSGTTGTNKIKIADESGSVARGLNISGEAAAVGAGNTLNGSYEKTVTFAATDTLKQVSEKINAAKVGVTASIIRDGNGSTPYKLNLGAEGTGTAGRFIVDSGSFDLGLSTTDAGNDARVFFGSSDAAQAVLITNSSNTLSGVITGVTIDLKNTSTAPVALTVSRDSGGIESDVDSFIEAFNDFIERVDSLSKYDVETKRSGALLGDATSQTLRQSLFAATRQTAIGNTSRYNSLVKVGITVGSEGDLKVDKAKLRAALADDPAAVEKLFTAKTLKPKSTDPNARDRGDEYTELGAMGIIQRAIERYTDSVEGTLTLRRKSMETQVTQLNRQIDAWDVRLATKRSNLEAQFRAMESAIGQLQTQQSSLSSIQSIG
ncbi:MAG: flagellar filament capping protein FliD [Planctomycetes bacterium]|nr:flagellar filament capping protein FliD [Planctomycetota bacterium]